MCLESGFLEQNQIETADAAPKLNFSRNKNAQIYQSSGKLCQFWLSNFSLDRRKINTDSKVKFHF